MFDGKLPVAIEHYPMAHKRSLKLQSPNPKTDSQFSGLGFNQTQDLVSRGSLQQTPGFVACWGHPKRVPAPRALPGLTSN